MISPELVAAERELFVEERSRERNPESEIKNKRGGGGERVKEREREREDRGGGGEARDESRHVVVEARTRPKYKASE